MKTIYSTLSITCLILFSCSDSTSNSETQVQNNSNKEEEFTIPSTTLADSSIENFPKHWVQVVPENNTIVFTEYCGMGHPELIISKEAEKWEILIVYGQDAERWELLELTANEKTIDNQTIQDGVFNVVKITYPDDQSYSVDYFWNKTTGIATFGDFFAKGQSFADNANKESFIIEEEKCDF